MTVLDHFTATFPEIRVGVDDAKDLASIEIASHCGNDCKRAIDAAKPLADLVREAHGANSFRYVEPIANAARGLCLLYICG